MDTTVKMRLGWVQHYEKTGNASLTSRRCGISRPTLRKWVSRYQVAGLQGLLDRSHRPKRCPPKKVNAQHLLWIGQIRKRRLGARRIQGELLRLHQVSFSTATIHKVLKQEGYGPLRATRRPRKGRKRYQKDVPGERVQMDVCKIAPKLYQFTAIDDCTRLKIIRLYPNKASASTLAFLEIIIRTFVLVFPSTGPNGSDIKAKADRGNGSNIRIDAQAIFGTAQRKTRDGNQSNDIDASSEFGASGQVQLTSTVDPNQGVAQIPETVVDPNALVSQSPCKRGSQSQFTRTGRGGLPPNLSDDLSGESTQVGLVKPAPSLIAEGQAQRTSSGIVPNENQTSKIENPIVPAQGWSFNDNGEVVLTAYNPTVTGPQRLQENPVGCPAF